MKRNYPIFIFCLVSLLAIGQEIDYENFSGIKASGPIPEDFTVAWADKYYDNPTDLDKRAVELGEVSMEQFWIDQNHAIDVLLSGGKFSFGDPVSNYINQVADKVLAQRPSLRTKLRFYLYRDPSANAFCVADGLIGINNGLVANIKSEAELAFVIAHETAHFLEEHVFEDYFADEEIDSELDVLSTVENRIKRSRGQELEADEIGLEIFLESGYDPAAVSSALITLYESYHPVGRCEINRNPFAYNDAYQLPEWAQREFNEPISSDYDYINLGHNHPNIADRINAVKEILSKKDSLQSATLFKVGQEAFQKAQKLARFENVRLNILKANYSEALYEIECLDQQYPNNKFLHLSKMRALYGLSAFKLRDRSFQVIPVPYLVPGPIKDMHFSLFQLNRYELIGIAIRYAQDLEKVYPNNRELSLISKNLNRMIYAHSMLKNPKELFAEENNLPERSKSFLKSILPELGQAQSAYIQDYLSDTRYIDSVQYNVPEIIREDPKVGYEDFSDYMNQYVMEANYEGMYILDPMVFVDLNMADSRDKLNSLDCEDRLLYELPENFEKWGFKGSILHSYFFDTLGVEGYNQMSEIKLHVLEARIFRSLGFSSARYDALESLKLDHPFVVSIFGLIRATGNDYYYFNVMDIRTGEIMAQEIKDEGDALLPIDFERSANRNLKSLRK